MDDENNQIMLNNQDIDMLNSIDLNKQHMSKLNSSHNADSPMLDSNGDSLDDDNDDDQEDNHPAHNNNTNNNNGDDEEDEDDMDSFILDQDTKTPGEILDEFCTKLKDVNTTLPDTVVSHYMKKTGFIVNDPKLVKIISIASQKFISEIVNDVMQHHKLRSKTAPPTAGAPVSGTTGSASGTNVAASSSNQASASSSATNQKNAANAANTAANSSTGLTLTLEDLSHVLTEYGINVKKPYYFM